MASVEARDFSSPDETRTPDKTKVQPGWRWSECIKPVAGTDSCQARHVGAVTAGRMHVVHDDGAEGDIGPGDAYVIEPGHDAWVVGDEPFIGYEFESSTAQTYARPSS